MRPRPQIFEKTPEQVKNIGIWFRYDSRTGTHNAYKEYREVSLTNAVNSLYQNMAGLSRAKAASIQILKTAELKPAECKRPNIKQFHVRSCPSLRARDGAQPLVLLGPRVVVRSAPGPAQLREPLVWDSHIRCVCLLAIAGH